MIESTDSALQQKDRSRAGTTLIEAIVAALIFALFIGGTCLVVMSSRQVSDTARFHYSAINIGKNRLERGTELTYDSLPLLEESDVLIDGTGSPDVDGMYRRSTMVNDVATNLREIVVSVEIMDRKTLTFDGESETIQTYHAKYVEPPAQ